MVKDDRVFVPAFFKSFFVLVSQVFLEVVFVLSFVIYKPFSKVKLFDAMKLPDIIIYVVWEVFLDYKVLQEWIINQSLVKLLSIKWLLI